MLYRLSEQFLNDVTVNIGETEFAALEFVSELSVI